MYSGERGCPVEGLCCMERCNPFFVALKQGDDVVF